MILTVFIFGMSIAAAWPQNISQIKPESGNAGDSINMKDLPRIKMDALQGSGTAAHRLARYYGFVKMDFQKELYWERIAAENGDNPIYMYSYALTLRDLPNVDKNERARIHFWMKKAASQGFKPAIDYLKDNQKR